MEGNLLCACEEPWIDQNGYLNLITEYRTGLVLGAHQQETSFEDSEIKDFVR